MLYRIRPFVPDDQDAVRRLVLSGLGEHFGFIDNSLNPDLNDIAVSYLAVGDLLVVAECGTELVGSGALVRHARGIGRLVRLSVAPGWRRQGVGHAIVAHAIVAHLIDAARGRNQRRLLVDTNQEWAAAIGLDKACGFAETDRRNGSVYLEMNLG